MLTSVTVLYDADCPTCVRAKVWLQRQVQLIPIELVAAGSSDARQRFPGLDHSRTLREVTVIGNDGSVYYKDRAWTVVLWSLARWRDVADHFASPLRRPFARAVVGLVDGWRLFHKRRIYGGGDARPLPPPNLRFGRADACDDDRCSPR